MTRAELYAVFLQQYCDREVTRSLTENVQWSHMYETEPALWKTEHATRVKKVLEVCKELAFLMFMQGNPQAQIIETAMDGTSSSTGEHAYPPPNEFLIRINALFAGNQQEWRCSPLKKSGSFFSFLHKTVQEYFVGLSVCQELCQLNSGSNLAVSQLRLLLLQGQYTTPAGQSLLLARRLLHGDGALNTVRFCADLVDKRVQNYVSFGPTIDRTSGQFVEADPQPWADRVNPAARAMCDIVQASRLDVSRVNPDCSIAAANARSWVANAIRSLR